MFCTSLSLASPCSEEDKKYAEVWNNYYDPQEAFDFGETIKKIIDEKDLAGLFENVDGELTSGQHCCVTRLARYQMDHSG